MSKKPHLRAPFDSQYAKGPQTLPEPVRQYLYKFCINLGEVELQNASFSYL